MNGKENKKSILPWILVLGIVLVFITLIWQCGNPDVPATNEIDFSDTLNGNLSRDNAKSFYKNEKNLFPHNQQYFDFIEDSGRNDTYLESYFHRTALLKLIKATQEQAFYYNTDVSRFLESAKMEIDKFPQDVNATAAVQIKKGAEEITLALKKIRNGQSSSSEISLKKLQKSVSEINGMKLVKIQQDQIFTFHKRAAQLLDDLNHSTSQNAL